MFVHIHCVEFYPKGREMQKSSVATRGCHWAALCRQLDKFCARHNRNRPTNMEGNTFGHKGAYAKYDVTEPLLGTLRLLHNLL
jgi:hypothetical protein